MDFNKLFETTKNILTQLKMNLFEFLPKIIVAVLILFIGFIIAKIAKIIIIRFISKIDRLFPNKVVKEKIRRLVIEKPVAKVIGGFVYWIFILFFVIIATETLGLPIVTTWLSSIVGYLPNILSAFLVIVVGLIGSVILRDLILTTARSAGITYGHIFGRLVQIVVILVSILIGMHQVGIDVSLLEGTFLLLLGAILFGTALSFGIGSKVSVSNILASFYLQKFYKIGDTVRIGYKQGKIIKITPIAVIMETSEGQSCIPAHLFNQEDSDLLKEES